MSSVFAKGAWSKCLVTKRDFFEVSSLEAQDALINRHSSPAAYFVGEGQASLAAAAVANKSDDDDEDCDEKCAVDLNDVQRVGAKRRLHDVEDGWHAKKRKVTGSVAGGFDLTIALVNQEAPAIAGKSTELDSVKGALGTAQAEAKNAKD